MPSGTILNSWGKPLQVLCQIHIDRTEDSVAACQGMWTTKISRDCDLIPQSLEWLAAVVGWKETFLMGQTWPSTSFTVANQLAHLFFRPTGS